MKKSSTKPDKKYRFEQKRASRFEYLLKSSGNFSFTLSSWFKSMSNCKLAYADSIESILCDAERLDFFVSYMVTDRVYFCTVRNLTHYRQLKGHDNIHIVYVVKVPIGHQNTYQYHIGFVRKDATNYAENAVNRKSIAVTQDTALFSELLDEEQLERIANYKSKTWLKKYLQSLIDEL